MRPFLSFQRQEGGFPAFRPKDEVNDPLILPLKLNDGSFEPLKNCSKIFFTGSLTGSESEIHRFDQSTEVIWVRAISSYHQFLLPISGSLLNVGLSFKRRKRTHLLKLKKRTQLLTRLNFEIHKTFDQRWTDKGVLHFPEVYSNTRCPSLSPK